MNKPSNTPDATSPEMRDAILRAMAAKALKGNTAAAKIVLEEYRAQHGAGEDQNAPIYQLLRRIDEECGAEPMSANYH